MYITDLVPQVKILIAEDDILYKKVLIAFLQEDSGFKIAGEAKDGKTVVSLVKELRPDVVIMDLTLPVMSGLDAIKKIKKANPSVKVIVLTPNSDKDEAIESMTAGASAYVSKDINIQHFKMIIQTVNDGAIWLAPILGYKVFPDIIKYFQNN